MPDSSPAAGRRSREPWKRARWVLVAGLLAVAAAFAFLQFSPPVRERVLRSGEYRPTPGRLARETIHRPVRGSGASQQGEASLASAWNGFPGAPWRDEDLLDRAVVDLVRGRVDRAIAGFEAGAHTVPTAPESLTNLSAAYLSRFEAEQDCLDLLHAIDAAERGLAIDPKNPALRFNRAVALSLLGARLQAGKAWRDVIANEPDADWRAEAATRLRELDAAAAGESWDQARTRLESLALDAGQIEAIVVKYPIQSRALVEEKLLPRWAKATASGDSVTAKKAFDAASVVGSFLKRTGRDAMLDEVLANVRQVAANGPDPKRRALFRGLEKLGEGVAFYNDSSLTSAREALTQASADLESTGNPLRFWARFYLAIGEYYDDADRGARMFEELLADIPADRYPGLAGRIDWMAGTVEKVRGRVQASVGRYERAAAALDRAGGPPASAFVNVLLAETYTMLGEHSMGWERRRAAFQQVPIVDNPRRRIAMWTEAKEALVHQGQLSLARPLVEEAVENAEEWDKPLGRVVAYLDRAAYFIETGAQSQALADIAEARAALAKMEPSSIRNQQSYLASIAEGICYRRTDPARAARLIREGLEGQAATKKKFDAITYMTALAEAQISSGDPAAGADSLTSALTIFEDIRATVEDPVSRMQAFRQAQPAFDRLIDLRLKSAAPDREEIFRLAERARARVLLEMRTGHRDGEFTRLSEIETALPKGTTLVSYVVLDERVLAWVVEDGRARQVILACTRKQLEEAIARFRLELRRGADVESIREAAIPLHDWLIRPLSLSAREGQPLIVVPDRVLARLPFAALYSRETKRYLIEERSVRVTPSVTLLVQSPRPKRATVPASALVLGVSGAGTWRGRSLAALPNAEREARQIAAIYPGASLLRGDAATRENFLERSISQDVIHFAGHAVVDLEAPRRSVLLFAGPSGLEPLSLAELLDRGASTSRLVVLAGCGTQDSLADDREGLIGLAGAFVAAGVDEVVASTLDVDDDAAARVMTTFHRHYRQNGSAAVAMREAVVELLQSRTDAASPAAWGSFTVIQGSL